MDVCSSIFLILLMLTTVEVEAEAEAEEVSFDALGERKVFGL